MANFILIVDSDEKKRNLFLETIRPLISPMDGLQIDQIEFSDCSLIWAVSKTAPVDKLNTGNGFHCLLGEARKSGTSERLKSKDFVEQFLSEKIMGAIDGYHVSIGYTERDGVAISTDPLGLFPVYYYESEKVFMAGSSPELFRHHPDFEIRLDPKGLVGILLTNGLLGGRTLFENVRRLSSRHILKSKPLTGTKEIVQFEWPVNEDFYHCSLDENAVHVHHSLEDVLNRQVLSGEHIGLFLSGGRDSRMLAGYLEKITSEVSAFTFGQSTDNDFKCAALVAEFLGFTFHAADVAMDEYHNNIQKSVMWEGLANGMQNITDWSSYSKFEGKSSRMILGALCDGIVGGSNIYPAYSPDLHNLNFDTFFKFINGRAVPIEELKFLLKKDIFQNIIDELIDECRDKYLKYGERDAHKVFFYSLDHHERFHVGSMAWACSFTGWPVLPFCDYDLIKISAGIPPEALSKRKLQDSILCSQFKKLAEFPLDRNSANTDPLIMGPHRKLKQSILSILEKTSLFDFIESDDLKNEFRYYKRIWDFNNPGWMSIRSENSMSDDIMNELFNEDALRQYLPEVGKKIERNDQSIWADTGPKLILGFKLWAQNHLS